MTEAAALAIQVGGDHYKKMPIQPVEFSLANELNTAQSNIIKYACRHSSKDGARDLRKAIHYCDLWLDVGARHGMIWHGQGCEWREAAGCSSYIPIDRFIEMNALPFPVAEVVRLICFEPGPAKVKCARAVLVGLLMDHYGEVA